MDFHSLTRKELQTLCKRNQIPANITNVAMADALKALEIVEGLEEFMNQSQSPEKTMNNKSSQEIPSTVTKTSTRRKTTKEEPQSTQPTTRTRRTTRRTMELDEENKNLNVPETPFMATSTRRRAQKTDLEVGSTRRKVEAQKEGSVAMQQGYGTRRSVRLLEKCIAGLSLKESEKMEENGQSGAASEVPLARNLSASLEDERELKDDVLENSKCHNGESNCTLISEADSHKSDRLSPNEKNDEPAGEDKLADIPDGIIDPKGSDDIAVSEDSYEIVNLNDKLVADETDDVAVSKDSYEIIKLNEELVADAFEDISEEVLDHCSSADMEPIEVESVEEYANQAPQEIECKKFLGKDCEINAVHDEGEVSQNDSILPKCHMDSSEKKGNEESDIVDGFLGGSDIDDNDTGFDNNSLADELQEEVSCEQKNISIPTATYSSEDPMTNMVDEEALIDVNVAEADEIIHVSSFHNSSQYVVDDIPVHKMVNYGDSEALVNVRVKPAEEFAEEKSPTAALIPLSPLTDQVSQPTRFTPRKSSNKKQTTISKVTQVLDNINKENIDNNSVKEVEPCMGKVKKDNKNIIDEETMKNLEGMSLRNLKKLTKMFDKLEITDNMKNQEDKNVSKQPFGKSRPALQTLPQNSMCTEEKQN